MSRTELASVSDRELLQQLHALTRRERRTTFEVLLHLNEVERRRLHLVQGYASMFEYATRSLKYSASAAARRIRTARCLRRFPALAKALVTGDVNLSTVALISSVLTNDNAAALLEQIRGKSQRQVEAIVSEYRPPIRMRDRVRPVRVRMMNSSGAAAENHTSVSAYCRSGSGPQSNGPQNGSAHILAPAHGLAAAENHGDSCNRNTENPTQPPAAMTGDSGTIEHKLMIQFLADPEFMRRYEEVRALLTNRLGAGPSFENVFGVLMEDFIARHSPAGRCDRRRRKSAAKKPAVAKKKQSLPAKRQEKKEPQSSTPAEQGSSPDTRTRRRIPTRVRDEVWVRDGRRCTYVGTNGRRCRSRTHLHIDHIVPVSCGGGSTASNLRLLCAAHNQIEADRVLGADFMQRFRKRE
jgi:5-methylcytosine-specific restriction endonuclease McrA